MRTPPPTLGVYLARVRRPPPSFLLCYGRYLERMTAHGPHPKAVHPEFPRGVLRALDGHRCSECGGLIGFVMRVPRWREVEWGLQVRIPDDFPTPQCARCGEGTMLVEVSEPLDRLLRRLAEERLHGPSAGRAQRANVEGA